MGSCLLLGKASGTSRISIDMSSSLVDVSPGLVKVYQVFRNEDECEQVFPDPRLLTALVPLHGRPPGVQVGDLSYDDPVEVKHVEPQLCWPPYAGLADGRTAILSLSVSISPRSAPLVFLLLLLPHFCINLWEESLPYGPSD